jgi:hypothetical protein
VNTSDTAVSAPQATATAQRAALIGTLGYLFAAVLWGLNLPLSAALLQHFDPFWVGGFNPSSQHIPNGGVDEAEEVESVSVHAAQAEVTREAAGAPPRRAMALLEGDRERPLQRGRCGNGRCVASCRQPLVPTMRRYAPIESCPFCCSAYGAIPLLR